MQIKITKKKKLISLLSVASKIYIALKWCSKYQNPVKQPTQVPHIPGSFEQDIDKKWLKNNTGFKK